MTDYNNKYYYIDLKGNLYPLVNYVTTNYGEGDREEALDLEDKRVVAFGSPTIDNPQFADYHFLKQHVSVISKRMKETMEEMQLKNVQFLPTQMKDYEGGLHDDYFIVHVYNMVAALDKEKSDWSPSPFDESMVGLVDKLVLDNSVIDAIPLEERLLIELEEDRTHVLYHHSIAQKILDMSPIGLTFRCLAGSDSSLPFIEEYLEKRFGIDIS
ncbi:MAG: imm11 family protein [Oscillospiraceae bacterium]